mmetsp:Transcript_66031/g.157646  ORF Transcript_66031/g.157646 Transcript_66031/m.157646 type:complete len:279 (-) Transcript_66031:2870-3706(-)
MGGQHHRLVGAPMFDDLPQMALGTGVHGGRGLVQEKHLRVADESNAHTQLPLHPPAVGAHGLAARLFQTQARQEPRDLAAQELLGHALEAPEVPKVVLPRQLLPKRVHLWTNPQHLEGLLTLLALRHIVPVDAHLPLARVPDLTGQDPQGGGLARAVGAQQAEALPLPDAQADVLHRVHVLVLAGGNGTCIRPAPGIRHPVSVAEPLVLGCIIALVLAPGFFCQHVLIRDAGPLLRGQRGLVLVALGVQTHQVGSAKGGSQRQDVQRNHRHAGEVASY